MRSLKKNIRFLKWYPPYLGSGIKLASYNEEFTRLEVVMKMHWWNRNLVGTHFGGSLYSMCDPFHMFILMENLGKDYIVWDKSAVIKFLRPIKQTVYSRFLISDEQIKEIKEKIKADKEYEVELFAEFQDKEGKAYAFVSKNIYIADVSYFKNKLEGK